MVDVLKTLKEAVQPAENVELDTNTNQEVAVTPPVEGTTPTAEQPLAEGEDINVDTGDSGADTSSDVGDTGTEAPAMDTSLTDTAVSEGLTESEDQTEEDEEEEDDAEKTPEDLKESFAARRRKRFNFGLK